jgi:GGDEF domain-containing protein
MRGSFRFHDLLYRFGGEEFVVLMRCDDESHAARPSSACA